MSFASVALRERLPLALPVLRNCTSRGTASGLETELPQGTCDTLLCGVSCRSVRELAKLDVLLETDHCSLPLAPKAL